VPKRIKIVYVSVRRSERGFVSEGRVTLIDSGGEKAFPGGEELQLVVITRREKGIRGRFRGTRGRLTEWGCHFFKRGGVYLQENIEFVCGR